MTRGRPPDRAFEIAEKIAKGRGLVHFYQRGPGLLADFTITNREAKAEVKVRRMRRIRCTLAGLEREAAEEIANLRFFPSSNEISRELWIYSPDYFWRFFRILDHGLVELARDGMSLQSRSLALKHAGTGSVTGVPAPLKRGGVPVTPCSAVPVSGEALSPTVEDPPGEGCGPGKPDSSN